MFEVYIGDNMFLLDIQVKFNEGKLFIDWMVFVIINVCECENIKGDWQIYFVVVEFGFEEFLTGRMIV